MAENLYVAAAEARTGKSLVVLGLAELLTRRVSRLGFFRPVVRAGGEPDGHIELIRHHCHLSASCEACYGVEHDVATRLVSGGQSDELIKRIIGKYKELENSCDFVLCEGTDFRGIATSFEFEFNAEIAAQLNAPVLIVASGQGKDGKDISEVVKASRGELFEEGCDVAATIVNRVCPDDLEAVRNVFETWDHPDPVFLIPEKRLLMQPTVGEIAEALKAEVLHGTDDGLNREALSYIVAAMHIPRVLDHLAEGCLVVTPGDRADVVLGCLATLFSRGYPNITGILLTGGIEPDEQVRRLVAGMESFKIPILSVGTDTYQTAAALSELSGEISKENDRKIATALGLFEEHVDASALRERLAVPRSERMTPLMFEYELIERAKSHRQHIVLPEGTDERILRAAEIILRRDIAEITLLGDESELHKLIASLNLNLEDAHIIDPQDSSWNDEFVETICELRRSKGVNEEMARDLIGDFSYFGTMMVQTGKAGGMVSGATHTTAETIRPAFQIIKAQEGYSIVSSVFFMCLADRVLVYGDCAVNPNPTPEELADIAVASADTAQVFGVEPRIAMLSYSTGESGAGEDVDRVRKATRLVKDRRPDLMVEGPIQYDAAIDAGVAQKKLPDSQVAGRATVYIFPDLNTGNNTYKAVQRSSGAVAVGPVLQGLNKPVNDLSRGCTVTDIVNTVAITAVQAQIAQTGN